MSFGSFDLLDFALKIPAVLVAMTFHEYAHALMAVHYGDYSPKFRGRLTLSPLAHIDLIGLLSFCILGFGWAKPVEVDMANLRGGRKARMMVSAAGILMNLAIALAASIIVNILDGFGGTIVQYVCEIFYYIMYMNALFAVFNILPVPPLDGYRLLSEKLYYKNPRFFMNYERWGRWVLIGLAVVGALSFVIGWPTWLICNLFLRLTSFL